MRKSESSFGVNVRMYVFYVAKHRIKQNVQITAQINNTVYVPYFENKARSLRLSVSHYLDAGCLIDNIFVEFGGRIFQQTVRIPMGTNCAPFCFYTRMGQSLYKVSSKQARNTSHNNSISPTDI